MKQQINLFRSLPRARQNWFGHVIALQVGVGFVVLLILVSFLQAFVLGWNKHNLAVLQKSFIEGTDHLQKEQAALGGVDLLALQQELATKTQMVKLLHIRTQEGQGTCSMLSDYLDSFSSAQLSGLWLTKFRIEPDSRNMNLAGLTYDPLFIVNWVKKLGTTPCFSGVQFLTIDVQQSTDATNKNLNIMQFNLSSVHANVKPVGVK
ncbi:MAG TPA: hypothetical protein VGV92_07890 [Gammaproteobacteria bacterium]|nr:hypothetical protein [Gammaproteobacteria bacterium]